MMAVAYAERTVEDLRAELKRRDLSTSGNRAELVRRLEEDDRAGQAEQAARAEVAEVAETQRRSSRECVVDDGTAHMGFATPGARICSAHAMRYRADGTLRGT